MSSNLCLPCVDDVLTNEKISVLFKCGIMGGMRRSHKTNSLVLIADFTKKIYCDRWCGSVFHYTGMGKSGNQEINYKQNKTLAESEFNGINVYLFEVLVKKRYIFKGQVYLCGEPYQEKQPDENNKMRNVLIFPLKIKS